MVYAGFKYLLPLVAPFFAGYLLALILRPSARFISWRWKITLFRKTWRVPVGAVAAGELILLALAAVCLVWQLVPVLLQELRLMMTRLPFWIDRLDLWLTGGCRSIERTLGLKSGCMTPIARELAETLIRRGREAAMPFVMNNSVAAVIVLGKWMILGLVTFFAAILSLQEMEELREKRDQSLFRREIALVGNRLIQTGRAWCKSQGLILLLVSGLCVGALALLKNPYCLLLGVGIALADALPILGAGTILLPWAVISCLSGNWYQGILLAVLYVICYIVRQVAEVKLMGEQVGLSALETLASVYVGLKLFGICGVVLGPLGLLLIRDLTDSRVDEK